MTEADRLKTRITELEEEVKRYRELYEATARNYVVSSGMVTSLVDMLYRETMKKKATDETEERSPLRIVR